MLPHTTLSQGMESDATGLTGLLASQPVPIDPGAGGPLSPSLALGSMGDLQLGGSTEPLDLEPGSELAGLYAQLMAPDAPGNEGGFQAEPLDDIPAARGFRRAIGKPRSASAAKSLPPPRSTLFVGGCEIDKKKNRRRPDPLSAESKAVNARAREAASLNRNLRAETNGKHLNNERNGKWAYDRWHRMRHVIVLLTTSSQECSHELLSDEMRDKAMHLCDLAAFQASQQDNSCKLETGSANFWGVALALEAHRRSMGNWVVGTPDAKDRMSWETLEVVMEENHGVVFPMRETHWNEEMEARKTPKQVASGVKRSIGSHSFGSKQNRIKKLKCLDMLLKNAGDQGLHPDILAMRDPQVMRYDTANSAKAIQERKAVESWAKKVKDKTSKKSSGV